MEAEWRPVRAYVPGKTPRHPEDAFDALKADVDHCPPEALGQTNTFAAGMFLLREGYFWEAHEVLEAVWMAARPNSAEKLLVQGLIQHANAGLKDKMGRQSARARLTDIANALLAECWQRAEPPVLGLTREDVERLLKAQYKQYNA